MNAMKKLVLAGGLPFLLIIAPLGKGLYFAEQLLPVMILLALLFLMGSGQDIDGWRFHLLDGSVLILLAAYILALPGAVALHSAILEALKMTGYIMVYGLAVWAAQERAGLKLIAPAVFLGGLMIALIGLGAALGWVNFDGAFSQGHIRSTLQYHNATAIYLAAASLLGLGLAFTSSSRWRAALYLTGVYLLVLTVLGTLSRATWALLPIIFIGYSLTLKSVLRRQALKVILILFTVVLVAGRVMQNAYLAGASFLALAAILTGGFVAAVCFFLAVYRGSGERGKKGLVAVSIALLLMLYFGGQMAHPAETAGQYLFADRVIVRADQTFTDSTSQMERLVSYRDALKIIRDYPLIGTGGGGWAALYHSYADRPYVVNEMHNYYLKVAVETGIPGLLAVAAIGILFLRLLYKHRQDIIVHPDGALIWAAALAVVLVAVHAGMDFDLSIPAIAFAFFALLGVVHGTLSPSPAKTEKSNRTPFYYRWLRGVAVLGAVIVMVTAGGMYAGLLLAEKGAGDLAVKKLDTAESYYQRAAVVDPWNPEHQANLARISALQAVQHHDRSLYDKALSYTARSLELGGGQPELQANLFVTYGLLGRQDLQVEVAEQATSSNPFTPEPYRVLAASGLDMIWRCLDTGDYEQANLYMDKILSARKGLPSYLQGKIPELELAAGQAALLKADITSARYYLKPITYYRGATGRTARIWSAGADHMQNFLIKPGLSASDQTAYLKQLQQFLIEMAQEADGATLDD